MDVKNKKLFEDTPVAKAVATLAIPTVIGILVTVVYNMVDVFFVGQTGDPNQVAAVSIATPVFLILMSLGNMFGIGGSAFISRMLGEKKGHLAQNISSFCFYGGLAIGVVAAIGGLVFMDGVLGLIGASSDTWKYAKDYLLYIFIGTPFIVLSSAFGHITRSEGAAKVAMTGMMVGTIINIILDPIMILSMNMGVAGAAIATIIGNIAATIFYMVYLCSKRTQLSIAPSHFAATGEITKGVLSIGIPASLNTILMSVSNIVLNNLLASYSDNAVASMGIVMKVTMLVVMVQLGIAMGVQPLIGYSYGAKKIHRLKQAVRFSMACTFCIGLVLTVVYWFGAPWIVASFINDGEIISQGTDMLRALMLSAPLVGFLMVITSSLQAMGKIGPSLILSVSRQGLVFIPAAYILNAAFGLSGVIYTQPVADVISLVLAVALFVAVVRSTEPDLDVEE